MVLDDGVSIELVFSPGPRQVQRMTLCVPAGTTIEQAVQQCAWDGVHAAGLHVGVWGRKMPMSTVLRSGDRVEIYRPLQVDPKEARRVRYRAHGEKLPKGYHRPKDKVKDMTQSPLKAAEQG